MSLEASRSSGPARPEPPRHGSEAGFVAGAEALTFGVLIFVIGTLLIANLWLVIDARFAVAAAAREAVRAVVDAPVTSDPLAVAAAVVEVTLAGYGIDPQRASVEPVTPVVLERCAEIAIQVTVEVPALLLPGIERRITAFTVRGEHREIVSPFRGGLEAGGRCGF